MEAKEDVEIENVGVLSRKYGLRVRLFPRPEEVHHEKRPKKQAMTNAERQKKYRERRATNQERQRSYLEMERLRSQLRRKSMNDEQRRDYNAKAAIRNAKSRSKKRDQMENDKSGCKKSTSSRRSKRLDEQMQAERKEKERRRVQSYRDNMTPQKRRRVNEKRMQRYYAAKHESVEKENGSNGVNGNYVVNVCTCGENENVAETEKHNQGNGGSREDELRVSAPFACFDLNASSNTCEILQTDPGATTENQNPEVAGDTENANSSPEPLDRNDPDLAMHSPFLKQLGKTKNKRDKLSLKFRRFLAKSVVHAKDSYRKVLGFDRRTMKKTKPQLYQKTSKVQSLIADFYEENSIHMPHIKTVSKKTLQQKKIMEIPMKNLYEIFKLKHSGSKVSLRTFFRHRPDHILSSTKMPLLQSRCEICINPALKLKAFNKTANSNLQLSNLIDNSMCPKNGNYHKPLCLQRLCDQCGPLQVSEDLKKLTDPSKLVTWQKWDYVASEKKKHLELTERQGFLEELIDELISEINLLPAHKFAYLWQAEQYKQLKASPPEGSAVCTFDFAQNYTCISQDQPQSSYYGMRQIAVHPVVIHRQCPNKCGVITNNMVFLSDDLKHDAYFVQEVMGEVTRHLNNCGVQKAYIFSDGASSQYKAKLPFSLITEIKDLKIERHFFGSRHGKSACDALGGVVKTAARQAVTIRQTTINNAKEMHAYCSIHLTQNINGCCGSSRTFHLLSEISRVEPNQTQTLKTVPGTRKIHAVVPLASNVIATRNFSCFCSFCLKEDYGHCRNADYVSAWDKIKLAGARPDGLVDPSQGLPKDRATFFDAVQKKLCSMKSFKEFKYNCEQILTPMAEFPLQKSCIFVRDLKCAVDKIALALRPSFVAQHCVPLVTVGDGNCMPRSLCIAFSGSDSWHKEMRCRIAIELALNAKHYLDEEKLSATCDGEPKNFRFLDVIPKLSDSIVSDNENDINVTSTFQAEVMKTCVPCTYMGMWQLCAAATVLNTKIISIYPSLGWGVFQNLHNRIIRPREGISPTSISIMWSSSRNDMADKNWVANHIVPMIFMSNNGPESEREKEIVVAEEESITRNLWDDLNIF